MTPDSYLRAWVQDVSCYQTEAGRWVERWAVRTNAGAVAMFTDKDHSRPDVKAREYAHEIVAQGLIAAPLDPVPPPKP